MENPRHWRLRAQRCRLEGSACPACGQPIFPPRPVCQQCAPGEGLLTPLRIDRQVSLPMLERSQLAATDLTGIEPNISYRIMERSTG